MSDALDFLVKLLDIEPIEVNIFRGVSPDEHRQRVFGGQVAAQALMAAGRTVERGRVHSLHAYFLRPGDPNVPILYEVDRIRDGRSFTTRRVVAIQHGQAIFNVAASFHVYEEGAFDHQVPMPEVPEPETLPSLHDRLEPLRDELADWFARPHPIDQRHVGELPWMQHEAQDPVQRVWIRADGTLPDDPLLHSCVAAYASDMSLFRHHARPPRGAVGRLRVHGGEPGPLHVVPPALSGRRLAPLRHGQPQCLRGPRPGAGLSLRP